MSIACRRRHQKGALACLHRTCCWQHMCRVQCSWGHTHYSMCCTPMFGFCPRECELEGYRHLWWWAITHACTPGSEGTLGSYPCDGAGLCVVGTAGCGVYVCYMGMTGPWPQPGSAQQPAPLNQSCQEVLGRGLTPPDRLPRGGWQWWDTHMCCMLVVVAWQLLPWAACTLQTRAAGGPWNEDCGNRPTGRGQHGMCVSVVCSPVVCGVVMTLLLPGASRAATLFVVKQRWPMCRRCDLGGA
jgi:hypothetical protein